MSALCTSRFLATDSAPIHSIRRLILDIDMAQSRGSPGRSANMTKHHRIRSAGRADRVDTRQAVMANEPYARSIAKLIRFRRRYVEKYSARWPVNAARRVSRSRPRLHSSAPSQGNRPVQRSVPSIDAGGSLLCRNAGMVASTLTTGFAKLPDQTIASLQRRRASACAALAYD